MKKFTDFNFHMYTEMVFGKEVEKRVSELILKYNGGKVMMVYGGGSMKKSGLYDTVAGELHAAKIPFIEFGGVQSNPRRSLVEKGIAIAQNEKIDFLLGIGGGSAIDTAKTIALGLVNDGDYWQFYNGVVPTKTAPVGAIPTIPATGSETSDSAVLIDDIETGRKRGFHHAVTRPVFAIMNPELTYSVPLYQKSAGVADILSHTIMRYFIDADCYLGDQFCESLMRTVIKYGPVACACPTDYEAHAEIMLAASFSHNNLMNTGRYTKNRGGEHALERQLSGFYDIPHGAGISVVMPAWLQFIVNHGSEAQAARVAQFGVKVFGVEPDMADVRGVANGGLKLFRTWLKSIGMPLTLKELEIPKEDLSDIIGRCIKDNGDVLAGYMPLDRKAVSEIFTSIVE